MSIKAKIAAGAATLTIVGGGLAMVGTLTASAATPPCTTGNGHNGNIGCTQLFSQKYGPKYVVDVYQAKARAGQPIILFQASNSDPAEDFTASYQGTVGSFYQHNHGVVSAQFAHSYGGDPAFELEYSPYGLNSNFCMSTPPGQASHEDDQVTLQSCGQSASSLFAFDLNHITRDRRSAFGADVPLISGATTQFSNPLVLNYPAGNPTDMPRPQLNVEPEQTYSGGTVFDNQEWGAQGSPVHGAP
jgi:hypothetical protein